jgi:hypothetical protein
MMGGDLRCPTGNRHDLSLDRDLCPSSPSPAHHPTTFKIPFLPSASPLCSTLTPIHRQTIHNAFDRCARPLHHPAILDHYLTLPLQAGNIFRSNSAHHEYFKRGNQ